MFADDHSREPYNLNRSRPGGDRANPRGRCQTPAGGGEARRRHSDDEHDTGDLPAEASVSSEASRALHSPRRRYAPSLLHPPGLRCLMPGPRSGAGQGGRGDRPGRGAGRMLRLGRSICSAMTEEWPTRCDLACFGPGCRVVLQLALPRGTVDRLSPHAWRISRTFRTQSADS